MKKSTKHMQFIRISLLIFALGFFFACSLGTQRYGKLSLSIEIPEYLKTEPNEQPSNARFIHPDGKKLEFQLFVRDELFFEQTIPLNPGSESPQTVSISVDKVPYNVPLFAKITVFGETTGDNNESILGQNTIDIGQLRYPTQKLTLGVKPVSDTTVTYENMDGDGINFSEDFDTFKIKTFHKKGLYTFRVYDSDVYLYDSDGKNYPNSCFIDNLCVFYHPEDKASIYYAYLSEKTDYLSGKKLEQDILITRYDDVMNGNVIVYSGDNIDFGQLSPDKPRKEITFTIYNPYPFTLNLEYEIDNAEGENVNPDGTEKFTFPDFPPVLLPGEPKKFTVIFETKEKNVSVPITISANGLKDFVLLFNGTTSGSSSGW